MQALASTDIVAIWDAGAQQHRLDRALTLLMTQADAERRADLARLPIGERDRRLWELREATFGTTLDGVTHCLECGELIEFRCLTSDVRVPYSSSPRHARGEHEMRAGEWRVRFRLPDSSDLAAVAMNDANATSALAMRCVLRVERMGTEVECAECPENIWESLDREMARLDPQAQVQVDLVCPTCGHRRLAVLDIAEFLWAEVAATARRLVREVDVLARAYGWSERDILSMTSSRRHVYLELAIR